MTTDIEASRKRFEDWYIKQYNHKPMPNPKQGEEPHESVYMTMFADGAWRGFQAAETQFKQVATTNDLYPDNARRIEEKFDLTVISKIGGEFIPLFARKE